MRPISCIACLYLFAGMLPSLSVGDDPSPKERQLEMISRQIEVLEEQGATDAAKKLKEVAERLKQHLVQPPKDDMREGDKKVRPRPTQAPRESNPDQPVNPEEIKDRIAEARERAIEQLRIAQRRVEEARERQEREAREQREIAERNRRIAEERRRGHAREDHHHDRDHEREQRELHRRLEHVHEAMNHLREVGMAEQAEGLQRHAKEIEREIHHLEELRHRQQEDDNHEHPGRGHEGKPIDEKQHVALRLMMEQIEELREEVRDLRHHVGELSEQIELLERRGNPRFNTHPAARPTGPNHPERRFEEIAPPTRRRTEAVEEAEEFVKEARDDRVRPKKLKKKDD